jgi:hypothetical protein
VLIFIQFTCWGSPASAATINFTPVGSTGDGTFVGEVVAEKIGKLKLDHGVVSVKGNVVEVLVSGADITQKKTVLSGVVCKSRCVGSGKKIKIEGTCFFTGGSKISEIDDPNVEELIDCTDGSVVSGHIIAINHEECEVEQRDGRRRRVPMAIVTKIKSPRCYTFSIPVAAAAGTAIATGTAFSGEGERCTFTATGSGHSTPVAKEPKQQKQPKQQSSKGDGPHVGKIVAITCVMLAIACAIAIPIAIACSSGGGGNNNAANQVALTNLLRSRQSVPAPAAEVPVSSSSHHSSP